MLEYVVQRYADDPRNEVKCLQEDFEAADFLDELGYDTEKKREQLKALIDAALDHDLDNAHALRAVLQRDAKVRAR